MTLTAAMLDQLESAIDASHETAPLQHQVIALARLGMATRDAAVAIIKAANALAYIDADPLYEAEWKAWSAFALAVNDWMTPTVTITEASP